MNDAPDALERFIARWQAAGGSERANFQSFVADLCTLLGVPPPDPAREDTRDNAYVFERRITFRHGDGGSSAGFIDCYRRACFVMEGKKIRAGAPRPFDDALQRARGQGENYARSLPAEETRPPFVAVVDVGNVIELYAEFSRSGATYTPFPDPRSHRIRLTDLRDAAMRERLRTLWLDPLALDPARISGKVTREIATHLAGLARSLEEQGHHPEAVAGFLTRCLFTLFAEDVGLLPPRAFSELLATVANAPAQFVPLVGELWQAMDAGRFSVAVRAELLRFNGKLFKQPTVLPLEREQIGALIEAARAEWTQVEPAIFGTLLERALDPLERHALGAHYTPRAYVERLVMPTVIEPLRADWSNVQAAALLLAGDGKLDEARTTVRAFHHRLCETKVLDPACGSGNFLYVALEHMKRLEGEVLNQMEALGASLSLETEGLTVDPHQFLGLELNPRAAAIAELVLWIGYLQWHFRTRGSGRPPIPVLRDFRNIECRDAVLAYDRMEYVLDAHGIPASRWDGRTMKKHPVTGEDVPDEAAHLPLERYVGARKADWPEADFVVGNPPFIGGWRLRQIQGDGYAEALWSVFPELPPKADYVMYWWDRAADMVRAGRTNRFGLITTNSIGQVFQRRVPQRHIEATESPLSLVFAIPDHPWVDSADGAAVRIAMTVGEAGNKPGVLKTVRSEAQGTSDAIEVVFNEQTGRINADLSIGADVAAALPLRSNAGLCSPGVQLYGSGFIVDAASARRLLDAAPHDSAKHVIRRYLNGRDLMQNARGAFVIDFFGLTEAEARAMHPAAFQRVLDYVKPERDQNRRDAIRERWWRFGWERPVWRAAVDGLPRYASTVETSKHRVFVYLDSGILPDNRLTNVAVSDACTLGVLSSTIHICWALAAGGTLEDRPVYNKTRCFDPFPFPAVTPDQQSRIRDLAEQLDLHRKRQQALHAELTLTGLYNVLEKLKSGEPLGAKDRSIHEQGLVSVLKSLHDELDRAVLAAYGWSELTPLLEIANGNAPPPSAGHAHRDEALRALDSALLERLVGLNAERAAEEARGVVRWLRPEFQNPQAAQRQETMAVNGEAAVATLTPGPAPAGRGEKLPWPDALPEQVATVARLLAQSPIPLDADAIAARHTGRGPWKKRLPQLLETLVALGRARQVPGGYTP